MGIIQISVHPKGSSACAYWRCLPLCKMNMLPVSAEQASLPYMSVWEGRGDKCDARHICQPEGCWAQGYSSTFLALRRTGILNSSDSGFTDQVKKVVFSGNTSQFSSRSEFESVCSSHAFSPLNSLRKKSLRQTTFMHFLLSFYRCNSRFYQTQ